MKSLFNTHKTLKISDCPHIVLSIRNKTQFHRERKKRFPLLCACFLLRMRLEGVIAASTRRGTNEGLNCANELLW